MSIFNFLKIIFILSFIPRYYVIISSFFINNPHIQLLIIIFHYLINCTYNLYYLFRFSVFHFLS